MDTLFKTKDFKSLSVLLPVMNETVSLRETITIIEAGSKSDILEYILVVCSKTTPESLRVCQEFTTLNPSRFILHFQKLPFLGGAIREAFELARGSHTLMMASDLETNPKDVPNFIEKSKTNPDAIITASRWIQGGGFAGYSIVKWLLNFVFQKFFSLLYRTRLTDMTYGYRLFPTQLIKSIYWEELRHPFLFETILKPLCLGVAVIEIPSSWKARIEGESQNTFLRNFVYFRIGLKVRFYHKNRLLKASHGQVAEGIAA